MQRSLAFLVLAAAALGCAHPDPSRMLTAAGARCPMAGAPIVEISGEVAHPGRYPLFGETTLRGAILSAGGVTGLASLHGARVARCGHRIVVDLDAVGDGKATDPALRPGDLVEISGRED